MHLENFPGRHLTYCTNIHAGENWDEHFSQLKIFLPEVKQRISPAASFGVGLRLSASAAKELSNTGTLEDFKRWMEDKGLYVFTINGFPYGSFHGKRVKDRVYVPDWCSDKRLEYTLDLIGILSALLPSGVDGGISTSPLSYKYWLGNPSEEEETFRRSSGQLAEAAYRMALIESSTGRELHLDIEPEPDCLLENSRETAAFFTDWLFPSGVDYLARQYGLPAEKAFDLLQRHIRVCYDTCHFAVAYEQAADVIGRFRQVGIRIGKVQVSSALKVNLGNAGDARKPVADRLRSFEEPTYLHQVVERRADGSTRQFRDLNEALPHIDDPNAVEWRIHFHVPIFVDHYGNMQSTQDHIRAGLHPLLAKTGCRHFEIETYTWEVLPEPLKSGLADSIQREFEWTLNLLDSFEVD